MSNTIPASTLEKFTTFGDCLRFLRRRAGITQMELSLAVGYSDAQISRLEQNLRLPDIPTIEARFVPALGLEDEPRAGSRLLDLAANVRREDAPGLGLCPYKGLSFFDENDTDLFAGREALTARLAAHLLKLVSEPNRFLAIVGASGSGKSSLARAGLVPALRWNKKSTSWLIHVLTPGAHPLESLASSLTPTGGSFAATAALIDDLAQEPRSLSLFLKQSLKQAGATNIVLLVDQFEEVFTLCRSEQERGAFIDNLLNAAQKVDGPVIVVITLRADFYSQCARYPHLRDALTHHQEYIGAMSQDELRRAIEEPAHRGHWEFEPGLVDLLLHDVGTEPGALPLLSHALLETWQRRRGRILTFSGYTSSGGVRGAIAETAETVFADQFTHEQQAIARRIFVHLTELGGESTSGDTRRRATFDELIRIPEEAEATQTVVNKLVEARLITINENSVEVAHEALIREWPTLRGWLEDDRDCLRLHRVLTQASHEWLGLNREPDLLFRGARLAEAREWADANQDELNPLECEFLAASISAAEQEAIERENQRQHELEVAQKLAEAEKQRAEIESQRAQEQARSAGLLRKRAFYLAGALVITFAMALVALFFGAQARRAAIAAQNEQRVSFSRELAAAAVSNLDVDPERSILLAMNAVSLTYDFDKTWAAETEDALRRALLASRLEYTLRGHANRILAVAYSPDGARVATASDDGTARIWDVSTTLDTGTTNGKELLILPTQTSRGRHGIAYSPEGKRLASASGFGNVKIWDTETGQELLLLQGHTDWISSVAFSPDGTRLVSGSEDRTAIVWDAITARPLATLRGHADQVTDAAFSPDGKRLVTVSLDGYTRIWDSTTYQEVATLSWSSGAINGVAFSPDGKRLATANENRTATIWDLSTVLEAGANTNQNPLILRSHTDALWDVTFSPDGTRLATTSYDGKVIVWDASTGQALLHLVGHTQPVTSAAFSPDCVTTPEARPELCGTHLVSASLDGTAKIWNVSFSREDQTLHFANVSSGVFSPDGVGVATGNTDGSVTIWKMASAPAARSQNPQIVTTWHAHSAAVTALAYSPDGNRLATASDDYLAKVWDLSPVLDSSASTEAELLTLRGHTAQVWNIVFSPDGKRLATVSNDRTLIVWDASATPDASSSQPLLKIQLPSLSYAVAFSPDGKHLAAGLNDGTGKIWDAESGAELLTLRGHNAEIWGIAYNPDGTLLATASNDRTIIVWDTESGQKTLTLSGHSGAVNSVAFSPDGERLASASQDGTIKLWNLAAPGTSSTALSVGQHSLTLYGNAGPVIAVEFSPDGSHLLSVSLDGVVRFYLLNIEDLLDLARSRVTRDLSREECLQYLHLSQEQCAPATSEAQIDLMSAQVLAPTTVPAAAGNPISDTGFPAEILTNDMTNATDNPQTAGIADNSRKVCELTDEGGVNDEFYNQMAYAGVKEAASRFGWESALLEPQHSTDYPNHIALFIESGCDLIVAPTGIYFSDVIVSSAKANPAQKFQVFEWGNQSLPDNVWEQKYAVDQAAFMAGYLAASMTKTGKVATFGGVAVPAVTTFMDGFVRGVAYHNEKNELQVQVLGWDIDSQEGTFAGNFTNTSDGRRMAEALMDQGADILLPVAGPLGLGAAAAAKERGGVYIIGVDTDWALTYPEYADILLTSIQKRLDMSVIAAVQAVQDGSFTGGLHTGTLANGGVSLAPFHKLEALVLPKKQGELEQIKVDIIAGKILTRP
jgi:WD40 repeat protein/basic membrane lipoprotein Med (substrate-binding protein (PBP1-ABC) superfamily)/transcriptional regulator with XRE-family HTH domain